ncbi:MULTISPECIES: hypothetical protein [unclassified Micromonospora]|uniref:hypothetical protein n=1 Tax=unclassified Micromonospora TaxID=2617518 RepID=UPI0033259F37
MTSVWTRNCDGATLTVTGITTIHGKPNVQYETSYPDISDRGVGISSLDHFLHHATEDTR